MLSVINFIIVTAAFSIGSLCFLYAITTKHLHKLFSDDFGFGALLWCFLGPCCCEDRLTPFPGDQLLTHLVFFIFLFPDECLVFVVLGLFF